jgi:hypothetical protein
MKMACVRTPLAPAAWTAGETKEDANRGASPVVGCHTWSSARSAAAKEPTCEAPPAKAVARYLEAHSVSFRSMNFDRTGFGSASGYARALELGQERARRRCPGWSFPNR